ncbi:hypothetical protein HDV02_005148 [Globomyces sp. JEL0801]|nr:hypothetical protein HDV02_005148 [Globomyces sp. JEL0801]
MNDFICRFPGIPGSRLFSHPSIVKKTTKHKIRLFVLERPGFGLSSPQPNRKIMDWPIDVLQFLNYLNLKKVSIIGYSAGGPYALAVAHALPQRLNRVAVISSVAPHDAPNVYREMPWAFKLAWFCTAYAPGFLRYLAKKDPKDVLSNPIGYHRLELNQQPLSDQKLLIQPDIEYMFCNSMMEIYARDQGDAELYEYSLWGLPWGFELSSNYLTNLTRIDIVSDVCVWHGECDGSTTPAMAKYIAEQVKCPLVIKPGYGHCLYFDVFEDVVAWSTYN